MSLWPGFPKGHVMERHPGPVMVIPVEHWKNFTEAMRPSLSATGMVENMPGFMDEMRRHFPKVAELVDSWGSGVVIQIWLQETEVYSPVPRQQMTCHTPG